MESIAVKKQITDTFNEVREYSFKQKREDIVNSFLDQVIELQSVIGNKTIFLEDLHARFEKITWLNTNDIDEETLRLINDIISTTRDISRSLTIQYVFLNNKYRKYASGALKGFKVSLDDIKEITDDIEDVFFKLPKDERFQRANDRIQSL